MTALTHAPSSGRSCLAERGFDGLLEQHGDGQWPHAPGHRGDQARPSYGLIEGHVAHIAFVVSGIHHHRPWFEPVSPDEVGPADGGQLRLNRAGRR